MCRVPADLCAVFSHRYQQFECVEWDRLCCSEKRLIPTHKHAAEHHLAFVESIINVLFWSLVTGCKLEQIWREGWGRGGGENKSYNRRSRDKETGKEERNCQEKGRKSVRKKNESRNKSQQEVTQGSHTEKDILKREINVNGIGRDSIQQGLWRMSMSILY